MDNARIQELTQEVLAQVRQAEPEAPSGGLEARVAALEAEVRRLRCAVEAPAALEAQTRGAAQTQQTHPSLQTLAVERGAAECVLEPDKPCTGSGQCSSFGH